MLGGVPWKYAPPTSIEACLALIVDPTRVMILLVMLLTQLENVSTCISADPPSEMEMRNFRQTPPSRDLPF